ncbi:hypothetical protein QQ008_13145 [Fulvivirgaceae bacterium BMA10]|uniref:DUF4175 family protein n=1 Tax=Splendidivirga corallicola TaxID=3051826 RepID=A0ABT8KNN9_9BACT|nr:hypothetical protein [Fulvivirgaceae bacterium BMA10]
MDHKETIQRLRTKWIRQSVGSFVLVLTGITLLCLLLINIWLPDDMHIVLVTVGIVFILATGLFYYRRQRRHITPINTARFINRNYEYLEESTELLLANETQLSLLEKLQRRRIAGRFQTIHSELRTPNVLKRSMAIFMLCLLMSVVLWFVILNNKLEHSNADASIGTEQSTREGDQTSWNKLPSIKRAMLTIRPPAYTRIKEHKTDDLHIKAPIGSMLFWEIEFTESIKSANLQLHNGNNIALVQRSKSNTYLASLELKAQGFYQLIFTSENDSIKQSDYYKMELINDTDPEIMVKDMPLFLRLDHDSLEMIKLSALISDDYGIRHARIIATVSKGSGESVKFREQKLNFDQSFANERSIQVTRDLSFKALGMEPGDELYFFLEAFDNRAPNPNRGRTEMYFIALKDTAEYVTIADGGLGVDLMPDYFRSQRQIIIDTEKLIADKHKISREEFKQRSNALGYDQKMLRLKYGQYLGEEAESGIAIDDAAEAQEETHDEAEETPDEHHHEHEEHSEQTDPDQENNEDELLAAYIHAHDTEEEFTYHAESIKQKLRKALAIMWDSELHLRLFDPNSALPYEYDALDLIKEIRMHARIYVQRIGFEPPPLKPHEKRLSGDLDEIQNLNTLSASEREEIFPYLKTTLLILEDLGNDHFKVTSEQQIILQKAGQELASEALKTPGKYLKTLMYLKQLSDNSIERNEVPEALKTIKNACLEIIPDNQPEPFMQHQNMDTLLRTYLKFLEENSN